MCKSKKQKGGPYRCPREMAKKRDIAAARATSARLDHAKQHEAHAVASGLLQKTQAMMLNLDDKQNETGHLSEEDRLHYNNARLASKAYEKRVHETQQALDVAAKEKWAAEEAARKAQFDYDSTSRGLAELQNRMHFTRNSERLAGLENRRDQAIETMNKEGRERDERWGTNSGEVVPMSQGAAAGDDDDAPLTPQERYSMLSSNYGLSATAVHFGEIPDDGSGRGGDQYEITFFRTPGGPAGDKAQSMKVRYLSPVGSGTPTQADVLYNMSKRVAGVGDHTDFRAFAKDKAISKDDRDVARAEFYEGRRYRAQLKKFLGEPGMDKCLSILSK